MLLPPYDLNERVRLIRLYSGMNQSEMARMLGMTQGWLSKLESGSSELTAEQLFLIRKHFQLSADAVMDGLIPYGDISRKFGAAIKLPRKYSTDSNCRARVLYGFVKLYEEELGRKAVQEFFRSIRVKPEVLADPDFPINLNLVFELIRFGMDRKILGSDVSWAKVAEHTLTPLALGLSFTRLSGAASPVDAFRRFCDLIGQFATDFEPRFTVASKNSIEISVSYPLQINRIRSVSTSGNVVALSSYTRAMLRTVGQISSGIKIDVSVLPFPEGGKGAARGVPRPAKAGREQLVYRAQWR